MEDLREAGLNRFAFDVGIATQEHMGRRRAAACLGHTQALLDSCRLFLLERPDMLFETNVLVVPRLAEHLGAAALDVLGEVDRRECLCLAGAPQELFLP